MVLMTIHDRCAQNGYQPDDENWYEAWDMVGSCTGTLAPTISPAMLVLLLVYGLELAGGCSEVFDAGKDYEDGDTVRLIVTVHKIYS